MYAVKLEQFQGPLALLLELIEQEKLDISTIALAAVTDGYLKHLDAHPGMPPEDMADFLVVASRLLLIKSRILLPFLAQEEEADDLEAQLKIYKEYLDASKRVEAMIASRRFAFVHEKLPAVEIGFSPPERLTAAHLADLYRLVIARLEPIIRVPRIILEKAASIQEKIRDLRAALGRAASVSFRSFVAGAGTRTEIIVCFLALLELVKQRAATVAQEKRFDDILVKAL